MIKLIASFGFIWQAVSPVNVSTSYQKVEKKIPRETWSENYVWYWKIAVSGWDGTSYFIFHD